MQAAAQTFCKKQTIYPAAFFQVDQYFLYRIFSLPHLS